MKDTHNNSLIILLSLLSLIFITHVLAESPLQRLNAKDDVVCKPQYSFKLTDPPITQSESPPSTTTDPNPNPETPDPPQSDPQKPKPSPTTSFDHGDEDEFEGIPSLQTPPLQDPEIPESATPNTTPTTTTTTTLCPQPGNVSNDSRHQQMEDTDHTHLNAGLSSPFLEHVIDVDQNHVNHGTHMEDGWCRESNDSRHQMEDTNTQPHIELSLSETQQSVNTNPNGINHEIHQLEDGWDQKVNPEEFFVITNFALELLSAVFDQLSSVHKPQYALISLLMSLIAMLFCIIELIHKGRKERVAWRRMRCSIPWFYNPSTNSHFGTFDDIIGLACAISQFILSTITYSFVLRNTDNPIKISAWPIIFAFGLLCSKFLKRLNRRTP